MWRATVPLAEPINRNGVAPVKASDEPLLRKHMPELDVLRGVAILVVVLYHGLYWAGAQAPHGSFAYFVIQASVFGWLGVNLFFVLSGFLITGILLDTKPRPNYFRQFYFRRVLRILPAYLATIAVLLIVHILNLKSTVVALLFLTNYNVALGVTASYGPFWSLSVEEQFYLLWPAIVRKTSIKSLTLIATGLCLAEPLLRFLSASGRLPIGDGHQATYLIADNLAVGVLAAIFARSRFGTLRNSIRIGLAVSAAGFLILATGIPFGILHRANLFGAALQPVPWNLIFAGALLLMLGLRSQFFAGHWTAPVRFLGYISYGLYLIHLLIYNLYRWLAAQIPNQALQIRLQGPLTRMLLEGLLAVFVAWLSRRFYEEPFLRRKFTPPAPST